MLVVFVFLLFVWTVLVGTFVSAFLHWRIARSKRAGTNHPIGLPRCPQCGYPIIDPRTQRHCPECGTNLFRMGLER